MPIPVTIQLPPEVRTFLVALADRFADRLSSNLKRDLEDMASPSVERLTAEVAGIKGAAESAVVLLDGLAAYIKANAEDPAAMNALADDLATTRLHLADAIARDPVPGTEPSPSQPPETPTEPPQAA